MNYLVKKAAHREFVPYMQNLEESARLILMENGGAPIPMGWFLEQMREIHAPAFLSSVDLAYIYRKYVPGALGRRPSHDYMTGEPIPREEN